MVVGIGIITLRIHGCRSLKEKRRTVKPIIGQVRNRFNVSLAEVGAQDIYQKAELGFALVGNTHQLVNSKMDKLLNLIYDLNLAEVVDTKMEILHL